MPTKIVKDSVRKPPAAGKGRPKGAQNKMTRALKDMILAALDEAGGVDYLVQQSDENPTAFLTLVGKVLPLQVANSDDKPFKTAIEWRVVNAPD